MTDHRMDRVYLRQYARLPELIGREPTPEVTEEALAFLCNREDLNPSDAMQAELASLDMQLAEALATASDEWLEFIDAWAQNSGFAASSWWIAVRKLSSQHAERLGTRA